MVSAPSPTVAPTASRTPTRRQDPIITMRQEVADVAALIEELGLGPVHIVGSSYGAFISLMLALHRSDMVRSVTAAEPPLLHWLLEIESGREVHEHFFSAVMRPSQAAFAAGDSVAALTVALDHFVGPDGIIQIPDDVRATLMAKIKVWQAIATAPGALPSVSREQLAEITVPVLLISGAESAELLRLIDQEAERVIPGATRVVIAEGTHEVCSEQPPVCAAAIHSFIDQH